MVSQCAYCYSSNRKSDTPFSALVFTSLNSRTKQRFDMLNTYQNWKGVEWWEHGYDRLWQPQPLDTTCPVTKLEITPSTCAKDKVVYLTADSSEELLELDPESTYIIGGIVDKNRYKVNHPPRHLSTLTTLVPLREQGQRTRDTNRPSSNRHLPQGIAHPQSPHSQSGLLSHLIPWSTLINIGL